MDALTIIIMIILFVLSMLFVFSTALLTPYIGKKNLLAVILLGLIVGVAAGAFLVTPIVDDLPDFTRTLVEESVGGTDQIELDLSTNGNLTQTIKNITSITGVEKVDYKGIIIKIDEDFDSETEVKMIKEALNSSSSDVNGIEEIDNKTFIVNIKENGDPQSVLDGIYKTFSRETYTHLRYTSMQANATVQANNVTNIINEISKNDVVILKVTGPTETQSNMLNNLIPDKTNIVLLTGVLGMIVAIAGFFVDSLITFISKFRKKRKKARDTISDSDKIKRKVVPGTKGSPRRNRRKRNSIDIFDESFEESPKQNIGSNKRFKQLTVDDLKSKTVNKEDLDGIEEKPKKEKKRFSMFKSSKNDKNESKRENNNESRKPRKSNKSGSPRFRPKRR